MRRVSCCLCGHSDGEHAIASSTDYISGEKFDIVECSRCGLRYVNPQPDASELHRYYPRTHQRSAPAAYERMDARPRVRFVSGLRAPGRALDVGCGKGLLLTGLRGLGWTVAGTELSSTSSEVAANAGLTVYNLPVEACPFEAGSFDVITLYHSLEHLSDPRRTLTHLRDLLDANGLMVIEVPNIGSWYAHAFKDAWFHLDVPRHLYHFDNSTLRGLLEASGYAVVAENTHANLRYDAFGAIQGALNRLFPGHKNLLNNFNTGETGLADLWRGNRGYRALAMLIVSEIALAIGMPLMLLCAKLSAPWVPGGTLNVVARRMSLFEAQSAINPARAADAQSSFPHVTQKSTGTTSA